MTDQAQEIEQLKAKLANIEAKLAVRDTPSRSEYFNTTVNEGGLVVGGTVTSPPPARGTIDIPAIYNTWTLPPAGYMRLHSSNRSYFSTPYWMPWAGARYGAYVDRTWASPKTTMSYYGGCTGPTAYSVFSGNLFPPTGTSYCDIPIEYNLHWANHMLAVYPLWAGDAAGAGNVMWRYDMYFARQGQNLTAPTVVTGTAFTSAAAGQYILVATPVNIGLTPNQPGFYTMATLRVIRVGGDAADTYAGNAIWTGAVVSMNI